MSTLRHRLLTLCVVSLVAGARGGGRTRAGSAGGLDDPGVLHQGGAGKGARVRGVLARRDRAAQPDPGRRRRVRVVWRGAGGGAGGLLGAVRLPAGLYVQGEPPGGGARQHISERGLEAGGAEPDRGAIGREAEPPSSSSALAIWYTSRPSAAGPRARGASCRLSPREDRPTTGWRTSASRGPTSAQGALLLTGRDRVLGPRRLWMPG